LKYNKLLLAGMISVLVTACGGSGGTDTPTPLVPTDTAELKNNAAAAIGGDFDGNLSAMGQVLNRNRDVLEDTNLVVAGGSDTLPQDVDTQPIIQNSVQSLVLASLAAGESSEGVTTRSGNTLNIDPDEAELCNDGDLFGSDESLFGGAISFTEEYEQERLDRCRELLTGLTVELIASGEESGEVNYLFQQQTMLKLNYAPGSESVELDLGGLKTFGDAYAVIYADEQEPGDELPSTMTGSFKMATVTSSSTIGQESGSVSLDIVKPINVADGEESISMAAGTLFAVAADVATGQGSLSFDVGAIAAAVQDDSGLGRLNMAGFTGKADVNPENGTLVVSNLGLSKGPFSLSVDNQEVLKLTLQSFGFSVSEQSDEITIDGDMDLSLLIDQMGGFGLEYSDITNIVLGLMAPSGTAFSRAGNGALKIGGAGPFSVTIGATRTQGDREESVVTVNSGECIFDLVSEEGEMPSAENCL